MNRITTQLLRASREPVGQRRAKVAAAALITVASMLLSHAAEAHTKIVRTPGGISPNPVMTTVTRGSNQLQMKWQAFTKQVATGSNIVFQVLKCPELKGTNTSWTTITTVTNDTVATTSTDGASGFLTVQQTPAPLYAGAERCGLCHDDTHHGWMDTRHAKALDTLKQIGMDKNARCLACHTVGFGSPNGYKDEGTTPGLAGVQCESCHGPAGAHATRPLDKTRRPMKTLSGEMCGGCHTDAHHPTYDEWAESGHGSLVIPEEEFADPTSGPGRMLTCGACHSGASRMALLKATLQNPDPKTFSPEMPSHLEAAETGITCATCHDAHNNTGNPAQLQFPTHSEINYSYLTATNFAANFNPKVQMCAQCHNMRGATWTGTSRPPHHSPQYNILIGKGGFEAGVTNTPQSAHMKLNNQCAQCHTHAHAPDEITETTPAYTGHTFEPTMQACAPCHDEVGGTILTEAVQANIKQQIAEVKTLLDQWATTKAPEALRTKYGALAWEFNFIGQLSKPTPQAPRGPSADEQRSVPDNIKQARYNMYLVEHDGSYGVHNGNYARFLLRIARDKVKAEL
jgi:hypothetical protein